jgi:hypothetical protein
VDKLNPTFQDTFIRGVTAPTISDWYTSETTGGFFSTSDLAWMMAQGWRVTGSLSYPDGTVHYSFSRRVLKPEKALKELTDSYTEAYNDGRQLNDQRYDDLLVLWLSILDKTEDSFNALESDDDTFETAINLLIAQLETDHTSYETDVDGHLTAFGVSQRLDINTRFDSELTKAEQSLIDRGMYSSTLWTTMSAGIERERTRSLNEFADKITLQELQIKHTVQNNRNSSRGRIHSAKERLREQLRAGVDRQVVIRNQIGEALHRLVEGRSDSYPDMAEIGKVAGLLGAGSPEAFSP